MKNIQFSALLSIVILSLASGNSAAQVVLEKAVVASGAGRYSNAAIVADLTVGQPIAGYATNGSVNGSFGFWHEAFVVSSVGGGSGIGAITALRVAPNPATDNAAVSVTLAHAGQVDITLHDQRGRQVARLFSGQHTAGVLVVPIDPAGLPSGTYHVAVQSHGALLQGSVTIIR